MKEWKITEGYKVKEDEVSWEELKKTTDNATEAKRKACRIVVLDVSEDKSGQMVLVNPEILSSGEELVDHEEGCLSLKGLYEHVKRPSTVKVRAQDLDGNPFEFDADGLLAVCVQHELDHLDGKVFIDHLSRMKKERARMKLLKLRRKREHEREEEA